ncbi:hypothetical protein QZH41_000362 [Actinostola sp. cb2023]|nr:hypothetical protein QZH41_000362 [Actinostola sp. cb2023]
MPGIDDQHVKERKERPRVCRVKKSDSQIYILMEPKYSRLSTWYSRLSTWYSRLSTLDQNPDSTIKSKKKNRLSTSVGIFPLSEKKTSWLIFSSSQTNGKWFLYVSNWIFIFIAIYFVMSTILSITYSYSDEAKYYRKMKSTRWGSEPYIEGFSGDDVLDRKSPAMSDEPKNELNFPYKMLWVVFTIASVGALQITLIYWSFFYNNTGINGINVTFLILNSVFITIELLISNIPIVLLHFFYSHVFQSIYILFTVIYWAVGGTDERGDSYIYKALDYGREPVWACIFVFLYLVIFQMLAHLYCFSLCNFRKWLVRKCY